MVTRQFQARRFVLLIDELYERGVELHCLCDNATGPKELFLFDDLLPDCEVSAPAVVSTALNPAKLRSSDDAQLSVRVLDVGLQALALASRRAVSRLIQVPLH